MPWVDRVPDTNLYIGGLHALYQRQDLFTSIPIKNIVSVLDFDLYEAGHFKHFNHIHIKIDDDPNEDILKHFPTTNSFINSALENGGSVFVHCAMGKSRSATIICAFLMWKHHISPEKALKWLQEGRGVCEPNPGFQEQLEAYHEMLKVECEVERKKIYEAWLKDRYTGDWYTDRRRRAKL